MKKIGISILWFLLYGVLFSNGEHSKIIHLAVLLPEETISGSCTKHSISMAIDDVNTLPGFISRNNETYGLQADFITTGKNEADGVESLQKLFNTGEIKMGVIGSPYKYQSEYTYALASAYAKFQISYGETIEPVHALNHFFFFPLKPSIIGKFLAARSLLNFFEWKKVAIIFDYSDTHYRRNVLNLQVTLETNTTTEHSIKVSTLQTVLSIPNNYSVSNEFDMIQEKGSRIILGLLTVTSARIVFCEAYKRNMKKPEFIWILFEKLPEGWASDSYRGNSYKTSQGENNCSESELLSASEGYISIDQQNLRTDDVANDAAETKDTYLKRLKKRVHNYSCPDNTAYAYDSVWVFANLFRQAPEIVDIAKFTYVDFQTAVLLRSVIVHNFYFEGITGPVRFLSHFENDFLMQPSRFGQLEISTHPNDTQVHYIGTHDTDSLNLSMIGDVHYKLFDNGVVPVESAIEIIIYLDYTKVLKVVLWTVSLMGVLIALLFISLTTFYLKEKKVKSESLAINYVMVEGSVFCYLSIITFGIDTQFISKETLPGTCWAFLILLSLGFTLTFGSLFAKTWQLYKSHMTPEVKLSSIKNHHVKKVPDVFLYMIVLGFITIDVIIIVVWAAVSPYKSEEREVSPSRHSSNIFLKEVFVGCSCKHETKFMIALYCYKGLLLIFGLFLTWQTRYAKFKIRNESKDIAMAIYNVVATSVIGVICVTILAKTTKHNAMYAVVAASIWLCNTTTLFLIFVPKIRRLIMSSKLNKNENHISTDSIADAAAKYTMSYMRKKISNNETKRASTTTLSTQMSSEHHILSTTTSFLSSLPVQSFLLPDFLSEDNKIEKCETHSNSSSLQSHDALMSESLESTQSITEFNELSAATDIYVGDEGSVTEDDQSTDNYDDNNDYNDENLNHCDNRGEGASQTFVD